MKKSTFALVSLVIWTSLAVPFPLSNAAASQTELITAPSTRAAPPESTLPGKAAKPAQPDDTISSPSFIDAVNEWIKSLSKEQQFQAWKQATWTSQPLGPGTHGWIVLLQSRGEQVGYMVIHAADPDQPDQYRLTEYGNGGSPLFSLQTLRQSLAQLELMNSSYHTERLYTDALHAVWKVTHAGNHYYIDAKTGELLPPQSETDIQKAFSLTAEAGPLTRLKPDHSITASLQLPDFDPYERLPWVKGVPAPYPSFAALRDDLERQKKLTFTAQLYNGQVTVPLPVTGYQQWSNEEVFLLFEQNGGRRAIAFDTVFKLGKLYPS